MTSEKNRAIAEELLTAIGTGCSPEAISELFHPDVDFEIPGDVGALPWIGRKTGRGAVVDFIEANRRLLQPVGFDVQGILASDDTAVVVGKLASLVTATDRLIGTSFAMVLTIKDGSIVRFLMLEDSFHVSTAARP
ncbi:nuclear transport factor 2 family protein [Sphingomonas sp. PB4P5]|uniref:nuclear transport factor 2 family protein n=1 Tax=Parasphingomonas puruogangriensis TaxID=3096155 RepID=UPI002FC8C7D9